MNTNATPIVVMLDPFSPVSPGVILFLPAAFNTLLIRISEDAQLAQALPAIQPIVEKQHKDGNKVKGHHETFLRLP